MGGSTVRCEEVLELLPEHVDGELHVAREVETHLASCAACSAELAAYRGMLAGLAGLRDLGEEPRPELVHRTLAMIPTPTILHRLSNSENPNSRARASFTCKSIVPRPWRRKFGST